MLDYLINRYGLEVVIGVAGGLLLFYVIRVLFAMREGIRWFLRAAVLAVLGLAASLVLLPRLGVSRADTEVLAVGIGATLFSLAPRRSRYIPARERRKAVARYEWKAGEKYDSKKHHLDHIWPHARGGSNTADNLRVLSKKENLRKGAKKPRLRDWL